MDNHNGLFAELDSLTSLTNCGNSFNDVCSSLPSLNNFKYQQPSLSAHNYQQSEPQHHSSSKASTLPQTQININNCNNNIFFNAHDDGLFDTTTDSSTIASSLTSTNANAKSNFIGYVRKDLPSSGGGLTVINNVNTNIVNNIQNPTNFVNGSDLFGSGASTGQATDQYHQISKNGETIINFNGHSSSMPSDTVSSTPQSFYGNFQSSFDATTNQSAAPQSMGTTGGGYQQMSGGSFHHPGNSNQLHVDHTAPIVSDLFTDYQEPLSTAKIINNFESKNPLKYQALPVVAQQQPPARYNPQFSHHPHPQHYPPAMYQAPPKMPAYDPHYPPRISRTAYPPSQHPYASVPQPPTQQTIDNYNRHSHVPQYHHLPHPPNGYTPNYYGQSFSAPMPYSSYPQMPYKTPTSYGKGDYGYQQAPKKDFYPTEAPYYAHQPYSYEELNSCAVKKAPARVEPKYNQIAPAPHYAEHPHPMAPHQNVMRAPSYQPMPKHYPMQGEMYHNYGYQHPPKMPQKLQPPPPQPVKQFKNYAHYEQMQPHYMHQQYATMQAKHPEKLKMYDVEDQIAGSKIPKTHHPYGYDPYYQHHHYMPTRSLVPDNDPKSSMAGINLRDFLATWNEIDDEEEPRQAMNEHDLERTIMREFNPMFVQKATADSFEPPPPVRHNEVDTSDGSEKLYVLESFDVPPQDLNKYKHLSVINKLPENMVVMGDNDLKLIEEIDLTRDKLYKSEFESEFEACGEEQKVTKLDEEVRAPVLPSPSPPKPVESPVVVEKPREVPAKVEKPPKVKKVKKEKVLKTKVRVAKRTKKYSLNHHASSVQTLSSLCVDFLNTSRYRNFAREQISLINKQSKKRILQDIKRKLNFDALKQRSPAVNQKSNHSVRINSLREICGRKLLDLECPTLKELCKQTLIEMDYNVVENYTPMTLKELCEAFIYAHPETFLIEEVPSVPKLQDLCKNVLSETNIFINVDEQVFEQGEETDEVYIVEESSGNVGELFETENLDSFEKSEILRKIQSVADDDEIIRAIGALHDDESIGNNNCSGVSNRNIANGFDEPTTQKFDSEMSFMAFMDDDLMHSVQHEEIVDERTKATASRVEILRHKHLKRSDERHRARTIKSIVDKSLLFQRVKRFSNAKRRGHIDGLKKQARAALTKLKEESQSDAKDEDSEAQLSQKFTREPSSSTEADASDDSAHTRAERNLPKLPAVVPSINEYKIDRKSADNGADAICEEKRRKLTFDESLLSIDSMYGRERGGTRHHHHHRSSRHHSSRDVYRRDQTNHSEAKRLVIPSYKLYDKNLDVKLKVMPYVRIEREEKLDGMVRQYN